MKKTLPAIIVLALISATPSFSQGTPCACERHPDELIELILDDLALLDKLKKDHSADSITIANFGAAIQAKTQALSACDLVVLEERRARIASEGQRDISETKLRASEKKLAVQKFLKWLGFGSALAFGILAAAK